MRQGGWGKPHGEYRATQRWLALRRLKGSGDLAVPAFGPGRTLRANSARMATRGSDRKVSSRGSSVSSRPVTAPSEPSDSLPTASESKHSTSVSGAHTSGFDPEGEPEPEVERAVPPHRHPEVIRLHRRPRNGRSRSVKILPNGNRVSMRREADTEGRGVLRPETPPPAEVSSTPTDAHRRYRCIAEPGAIARSGIELTTEQTDVVHGGEIVEALEHGVTSSGVCRVRCQRGWVSVNASNGQPILVPTEEAASDAAARAVPTPPREGSQRSQRGLRPPGGGSRIRTRLTISQWPIGVDGQIDSPYPQMPSSTLGLSAGKLQREEQLEALKSSTPPSGRQSVSSVARTGGALRGEWAGMVVKGPEWQRRIRKLKHIDPRTGQPTAVRPAIGVDASEVEHEARRLRGSIALFGQALQGKGAGQNGNRLWVRKGHVNPKPVDSSGAAPVGGRVGVPYREAAWQSPALFFRKIEDVVEEAEEASRVRAREKASKIMQLQLEREAARKIWVRGEQVELPPTPPPSRPWDDS